MTIYLYVKTHRKTGLKYLGKTKSVHPETYNGSGKYWKQHLKKHGYDVETIILRECQNNEEVREWGLYYSQLWDVVESDEWANLRPEDGHGGKACGHTAWNKGKTKETDLLVAKYSKRLTGKTKENTPGKRSAALKLSKMRIGRNDLPGIIAAANKRRGQTKETCPELAMMAEKKRGRTKETHEGTARQALKMKGRISNNRDLTVYRFIHENGLEEYLIRHDMIKKYSLTQSRVMMLIKGTAKSHKGWRIVK